MRKLVFVLLFISNYLNSQCIQDENRNVTVLGYEEKDLTDSVLKEWQHKDILLDTVPGISSELSYQLIENRKRDSVIVAIIDSGVDINHEDLKNAIWINQKEIPNNNIDDDNNGYVDDIHGWNFLGNKNGENLHYARNEYVRILKEKKILSQKKGLIDYSNIKDSITLEAISFYQNAKKELDDEIEYVNEQYEKFEYIERKLSKYFPKQNYSFEKLKTIDTIENPSLAKAVKIVDEFLTYDLTKEWLDEYNTYVRTLSDYKLNPNYNDRKLIGDDINDVNDRSYGNNDIIGNSLIDIHGTVVAGILAAERNNDIGIKGVADNVKLMILRAIPTGDEYDKDVALAIRYAVDNGASIINASFGKFFSPNSEMVSDAIKYASDNDVLIVHASGNDSKDIDKINFFPIDYSLNNKQEFTDNFINVSALNYKLNRKLPAYFSNYGKTNVDIFAPGHDLFSTLPGNNYITEGGTSLAAPIISGIAAVLKSLYPSLTAREIKNIILRSGDSYNIDITIPGRRDDPKVKFSHLTTSGRVANMFNAIILADKMFQERK